MTVGINKSVFVYGGPTGPTGLFETVNISSTGPTGSGLTGRHSTWAQLTGPSGGAGPTGNYKTVIDAGATGIVGMKTIIIPGYSRGGGAAGTGPTWNAADQTGITVSNLGHTATGNSFAFNGIRANHTILGSSTRKVYFEFPSNTLVDSRGFLGCLQPTDALGASAGFLSLNEAGTLITVQGGGHAVAFGAVGGHNFSWAIDFGGKLMWVRKDGGNWNDNVSANPATGTGGIGWAGAHDLDIACTIIDAGGTVVLNGGDSAFVFTPPTGFTAWG